MIVDFSKDIKGRRKGPQPGRARLKKKKLLAKSPSELCLWILPTS